MERIEYNNSDLNSMSTEVAEWLGCEPNFISSSFSTEEKTVQKRYFERYQQRHATVVFDNTN